MYMYWYLMCLIENPVDLRLLAESRLLISRSQAYFPRPRVEALDAYVKALRYSSLEPSCQPQGHFFSRVKLDT